MGLLPNEIRSLYVIGSDVDGAAIKIGLADNVHSRLRELQACSPLPIRVVKHFDVPRADCFLIERACHRRLATARQHGEWFAISAEQAIEAVELVLSGREWESPSGPDRSGSLLTVVQIRADDVWLAAIDEWRRHQPDIPGRSEAIRRIVYAALSPGHKPEPPSGARRTPKRPGKTPPS